MSNTEQMVSVPCETVSQAAELLQEYNKFGIARDLRALLAQPAAQHQGEPVSVRIELPRRRANAGGGYAGQYALGYNACVEDIELLGPLYTRPDAGEVERLRGIIRMHEKTVLEQSNHLAYMRAQLADAHALLSEALCHAQRLEPMSVSCFNRIDAALSASAGPSAPKDWCSTMERPKSQCGCPDCGSSIVQIGEPSAPKCKYCGDTGQFMVGTSGDASDGNAPIMQACEDCDLGSPNEHNDPVREALRAFVGAAYPVAKQINERGHNWSEAYLDEALGLALAALERKP